ncbi:MAG: hypothetical protein GXP32_07465 [Kiritimatiellaeota bacterium]|nr:hypothetical protein [Kiritimatiellota bacterium]
MHKRKYSVNTNGLKKKYSTKEIVEMSSALNLDGIEWGLSGLDGVAEEIEEMAERTVDAGLEVVGYINGGKLWGRFWRMSMRKTPSIIRKPRNLRIPNARSGNIKPWLRTPES